MQPNTATYYSTDADVRVVYCNNIRELWKNCNMNTCPNNGSFPLIHLRSVWRQCCSTTGIGALLSNWLIQFKWKKCTTTFRVCRKKYATKDTGGIHVLTLIWLQGGYTKFCWFQCKWGSRASDCRYRIKICPFHSETTAGQKNMAQVKNLFTSTACQARFDISIS